MPHANFCVECGERLARKGWGLRLGGRFCDHCARRLGVVATNRPLLVLMVCVVAAFGVGRYLRPAPPPLIIQRAANSPLSDLPVQFAPATSSPNSSGPGTGKQSSLATVSSEEGYICGARTQKGTPCHRRVHAPGERCFQHKGLPAMVPPEKLVIRPANSSK